MQIKYRYSPLRHGSPFLPDTPNKDAGYDIRSDNEEVRILPGETCMIHTSLYLEMPEHHWDTMVYECQVRSRSGLASKGFIVANAPGTIDQGYTGEVCILMLNTNSGSPNNDNIFTIKPGDRIAQLVFTEVTKPTFIQQVDDYLPTKTDRGDKGFGSSGVD